jgi:hypothetical protein
MVTPTRLLLSLLLLLSATRPGGAALLYTYDFPGSSASNYLAVNQTNPQPALATFGDFIRQAPLQATDSNVLGTKNWTFSSTIDLTQYEGFTVTANPSYTLNLSQISFDLTNPIDGPTSLQIRLFINGSAIAAQTSSTYSVQNVTTNINWDFTDLTELDAASTVEFRLYAWQTASNGAHFNIDNVATSGVIVPEIPNFWFGAGGIFIALATGVNRAWLAQKRIRLAN